MPPFIHGDNAPVSGSRRAALVAASFFLVPATAAADDAPPIRTLLANPPQLVSWIRDRDPRVDASRARVDAAVAARSQAGVRPNPQLTGAVGGIVLGATTPASPRLGLTSTTNFNVGVSELFEIGKRGPRLQAASFRVHEVGDLAVDALGARLSDATLTLGNLAYVTARRTTTAANVDAARTLQSLEKVRRDNKDLSGADYSRIELETQQLELSLAQADSDVEVALAECSAALFVTCSAHGLDEPTALDDAAPVPAMLPAIDAAIEDRPAREASRFEADALRVDAILADRRAIPDPTFGLGYTYDNLTIAGNQAQTMMFSLSLPLPFFDRGDHDAAAARANARALAADERATVRSSHGQVDALIARRTTLQNTIAKLQTQAVPKSTQILDQTRRGFDLGQTGLAELLLAERSHRELLLQVLDIRFTLFTVRAQLRQSLGLDDQASRDAGSSR